MGSKVLAVSFVSSMVVLNLGVDEPFPGSTYPMPCIWDIYMTAHDSSKITVKNSNNFLWLGSAHLRNCVKGFSVRKGENHCSRIIPGT